MHQQGMHQPGMGEQGMYQQGMQQGFYQPSLVHQNMYQQAQSYGAVQAQAPPTKEERKQMKKQDKLDDRQKRLERVRVRQQNQQAKDSHYFLLWMSGSLVLFGILLGLLLIGDSWCVKRIAGTGIGMMTMRTSLLYITIELDCNKSFFLESWTCKNFLGAVGTHSFLDSASTTCAIPFVGGSMCTVMSQAYHASLLIFGSFTIAMLCNFFAAFFLWQYYQTHHPHVRKWASALTAAGAGIACLGLSLWTLTTPDLGEIPRSMSGGGVVPLVGFRDLIGFQYGWTWFAACFMCFMMLSQCVVWYCFFMQKDDEEEVLYYKDMQKDYIASLEANGYTEDYYKGSP